MASCNACSAEAACRRCRNVHFCNSSCQRSAWRAHRVERKPGVGDCTPSHPSAAAVHRKPIGHEAGRRAPIAVHADALPAALAREVWQYLAELSHEHWILTDTQNQPHREGINEVAMRFHQVETVAGHVKRKVRKALMSVLKPDPLERLLVNFSKYEEGDFLDSHNDSATGNLSYVRRVAFVWHLTEAWAEEDGGLFIDEEADGGPLPVKPCFNTLVTFAVPRRHRVTRVLAARSGKSARFACFGWVVKPRIEEIQRVDDLWLTLRSAGSRAAAIICLREPLDLNASAAHILFAGLPAEEIGAHDLGELCIFAESRNQDVASALGVPDNAGVTVAVISDPPGMLADSQGSSRAGGSHVLVCAEMKILGNLAELRRFLDLARTIYSPCRQLDYRDSLLMTDLFHSPHMKVFVFIGSDAQKAGFRSRLDSWAAALRPWMRMLVADPGINLELMKGYGLSLGDVPTAVAEENVRGSFRFKGFGGHSGPGLDINRFRLWIMKMAKHAGCLRTPELL